MDNNTEKRAVEALQAVLAAVHRAADNDDSARAHEFCDAAGTLSKVLININFASHKPQQLPADLDPV